MLRPATDGVIRFEAGPVTIQAADGATKGPRRFSTVAYTGGELRVKGFHLPIVVDLSGLNTRKVVSANLDHDSQKRVGHVADVTNDGRQLLLSGLVSAVGASAQEFTASADQGYPWQASIEAMPTDVEEVKAGKTAMANGQVFTGPVYIARKATLSGVAFLPQGADDSTSVQLAASLRKGIKNMANLPFESWVAEMGFDAATLNAEQLAGFKANYEGKTHTPAIRAGLDAEHIDDLVILATNKHPGHVTVIEALGRRAIEAGWDERKFEHEVIRATMPQGHTVCAGSRGQAPTSAVIEAALLSHMGHEGVAVKTLGERATQQARELRCNSLYDIIRASFAGNRQELPAGRDEILRAAFAPIHAEGFSTVSLSTTLGNAANKLLMEAYNAFPSVARIIAKKLSAKNFKTHTGVRVTAATTFEEVGGGGELKHGSAGEATYPYSVSTYGRMFGLNRTDIINDDLGALDSIPTQIGRGAAEAVEHVFMTLFLGNTGSFFGSGNANYYADAAAGLSSASLNVVVQKLLKQTDANGKPISVNGKYLVVPPELKLVADELFVSNNIIVGGSNASTDGKLPNANAWAGKYEPLCSPYLSNTNYTGYSLTAFYLFGDPADIAAFGLAYLNGVEMPTVESSAADFNKLGVQFRGYLDFGACQIDPKGAVMSKGTS